MKRLFLLARLLLGAVLLLAPSAGNARNKTRVIIVGAGAAGLSAAREFQRHGQLEVVILEARARVGRQCRVPLKRRWTHGAQTKEPQEESVE